MLKLTDKNEWSSYLRVLKYCIPYKKRLIYAVICMALSAIAAITPPWLIKNVVDDVLIRKDGLFVLPELQGLNPDQLR